MSKKSSSNRSDRRRARRSVRKVTPATASPQERAKAVAQLLAAGRGEKISPNHYAEASELLKPLNQTATAKAGEPFQLHDPIAGTTTAVTVPTPLITLVHYANRSYLHVNGEPTGGGYNPEQAALVQRVLEIVEGTRAVVVVEENLRHLTV